MVPIKAIYNNYTNIKVDIIEVLPSNDRELVSPVAIFITEDGDLDWDYICLETSGKLKFTNCHYEDEYVPIERLGTSK